VQRGLSRGLLEPHSPGADRPYTGQHASVPCSAGRKAEDDGLLQDIAALRQRQQDYLHASLSLVA
jgi:hypothetical protein